TPCLTHLVTPIDAVERDTQRENYRYGRRVRTIAKVPIEAPILVSNTRLANVNLSGVINGNFCEISKIKAFSRFPETVHDLKEELWNLFSPHFSKNDRSSFLAFQAVIKELEMDAAVSAKEGRLLLVEHFIR